MGGCPGVGNSVGRKKNGFSSTVAIRRNVFSFCVDEKGMLVSLLAHSSDKTLITFKTGADFSLQQRLCHIFVCWHLRTSSAASWLVKCERHKVTRWDPACAPSSKHIHSVAVWLWNNYIFTPSRASTVYFFFFLGNFLTPWQNVEKGSDCVPACDWTRLSEPFLLGCLDSAGFRRVGSRSEYGRTNQHPLRRKQHLWQVWSGLDNDSWVAACHRAARVLTPRTNRKPDGSLAGNWPHWQRRSFCWHVWNVMEDSPNHLSSVFWLPFFRMFPLHSWTFEMNPQYFGKEKNPSGVLD